MKSNNWDNLPLRLTVVEACRELRVSDKTLYVMSNDGTIRAGRHGKTYFIDRDSVRDFVRRTI